METIVLEQIVQSDVPAVITLMIFGVWLLSAGRQMIGKFTNLQESQQKITMASLDVFRESSAGYKHVHTALDKLTASLAQQHTATIAVIKAGQTETQKGQFDLQRVITAGNEAIVAAIASEGKTTKEQITALTEAVKGIRDSVDLLMAQLTDNDETLSSQTKAIEQRLTAATRSLEANLAELTRRLDEKALTYAPTKAAPQTEA